MGNDVGQEVGIVFETRVKYLHVPTGNVWTVSTGNKAPLAGEASGSGKAAPKASEARDEITKAKFEKYMVVLRTLVFPELN